MTNEKREDRHAACREKKAAAFDLVKPLLLTFGLGLYDFNQRSRLVAFGRRFRIDGPGPWAWEGLACCASHAYSIALPLWAKWAIDEYETKPKPAVRGENVTIDEIAIFVSKKTGLPCAEIRFSSGHVQGPCAVDRPDSISNVLFSVRPDLLPMMSNFRRPENAVPSSPQGQGSVLPCGSGRSPAEGEIAAFVFSGKD